MVRHSVTPPYIILTYFRELRVDEGAKKSALKRPLISALCMAIGVLVKTFYRARRRWRLFNIHFITSLYAMLLYRTPRRKCC